MSFLFGGGRPQPTSAEKIAAAEAEIEMVSDMFNRYASALSSYALPLYLCNFPIPSRESTQCFRWLTTYPLGNKQPHPVLRKEVYPE